jgi:hypothetical protein
VLLLTPYAVCRPDGDCLNEVARALGRGLRIIPLTVVECEPPLSICRIQWLDMRACIPIHEQEAIESFNQVLTPFARPLLYSPLRTVRPISAREYGDVHRSPMPE